MTLKELKKMIAEEYTAYKKSLKEQPAGGDMPMPEPPGGPGVVVSDDDVDATGGDAEATLKDIFDMLKDFFEGGDDDAGADDEEKEDVEKEEDEEADLEEKASMGYGDKGGSKKSAGANAGFKTVGKLSEARRAKRAKIIAEAKFKGRFQKLANIKK